VSLQLKLKQEAVLLYEKVKREVDDSKTREKMMGKKVEKFEKASLRSKKEIKNLEDKINSLQFDLEDTRSQLQVS
jgi:hypothetical protein